MKQIWEVIREWVEDHRFLAIGMGSAVVIFAVLMLIAAGLFGDRASSKIGIRGITLKPRELVIYTVDSFADWGLADSTIATFKTLNQCEVRLEKFTGGGPMMERLLSERKNPVADVVYGLDATYLAAVTRGNLLATYKSSQLNFVDDKFEFDRSGRLSPVAYSYLAFMYDTLSVAQPPEFFGAMQSEEWKNKLILPDPRTTGQGRSLLLWTYSLYGGEGFMPFWKSLTGTVNTTNPSFDAAYGTFLASTAPMVLNYATREAYHVREHETKRYRMFIPQEGSFKYIEGVGITQGSKRAQLARKFVDYCLSEPFQKRIPTTLWMFPVRDEIPVPAPFDNLNLPGRDLSVTLNPAACGNLADQLVKSWKSLF
jgi:thiamine transport system substrate-binding protein